MSECEFRVTEGVHRQWCPTHREWHYPGDGECSECCHPIHGSRFCSAMLDSGDYAGERWREPCGCEGTKTS